MLKGSCWEPQGGMEEPCLRQSVSCQGTRRVGFPQGKHLIKLVRTHSNYVYLNSLICRPRLNHAYAVGFQRVGDLGVFAPPIKGIRVKAIVQQRRRQIGNGTEDVWTCDAGARGQHLLVDISLPHDIAAATWRGTLKVPGPFSTMATS